MATYSKHKFSNSSYGAPIIVYGTSSQQPTEIHSTQTSQSILDEVWLYASNSASVSVSLTVILEYSEISLTIPSNSGLTLVIPGLIISGNGQGATLVSAFSPTAGVISISGYVNRIS